MPDDVWGDAHLARAEIDHCGLCDGDGYRGAQVCDHVDRGEITRRGMQAVRAALKGKTA